MKIPTPQSYYLHAWRWRLYWARNFALLWRLQPSLNLRILVILELGRNKGQRCPTSKTVMQHYSGVKTLNPALLNTAQPDIIPLCDAAFYVTSLCCHAAIPALPADKTGSMSFSWTGGCWRVLGLQNVPLRIPQLSYHLFSNTHKKKILTESTFQTLLLNWRQNYIG